ncbi:MAG: hypothetical protein JJO71_33560 [Escherichia coli]|nr:hypothetical protein [Escherichia coli]
MMSNEIKLKNEAEKGTQSVDYETEMQKILDGYDAERQKNIIGLLMKLVGKFQPVTPKEFAAVSLIRYDTLLGYLNRGTSLTPYAIERIAYGIGYFWEKLFLVYYQKAMKKLDDEQRLLEQKSHTLKMRVESELREMMEKFFGKPGQDLMKLFSRKKDIGEDIRPYILAKLKRLAEKPDRNQYMKKLSRELPDNKKKSNKI